jgi:hypothetical protein
VTIIKYKDSLLYAQRMMNRILRPHKAYIKAYIDNIIIFFKTFEDHIEHLDKIFELFDKIGIILKNFKVFLDYPSIILLRQRVDGLEILYSKDRITTILQLIFPFIFKQLKTYLGLTD